MDKQVCVKCGNKSNNGLPLCDNCREALNDFKALAEYLNSFTGTKEDLLWIIGSEISRRQSSIINNCRVVPNYEEGIIEFIPKEPSNSTLQTKPWLWDRYLSIKQTKEEIYKLNRARNLAINHYEIVSSG